MIADALEREIVAQILGYAQGEGYTMEVHDEEGKRLERTRDSRAVLKELGESDFEAVAFYEGTKQIGAVEFVFGNGRDVIHDWRAKSGGVLDRIVERVLNDVDRIETKVSRNPRKDYREMERTRREEEHTRKFGSPRIRWMVWQLANDASTYGADAGKYILTSANGEEEHPDGVLYETEEEAKQAADRANLRSDITALSVVVNKMFPSGAWRVSAVVSGFLVTRVYYGVTKERARRTFLAEVRQMSRGAR